MENITQYFNLLKSRLINSGYTDIKILKNPYSYTLLYKEKQEYYQMGKLLDTNIVDRKINFIISDSDININKLPDVIIKILK